MAKVSYPEFFSQAFSDARTPYQYQVRLGEGNCDSKLINIPTGLGKTAAVVLAWLWNRVGHPDAQHREKWPRRLVYCLPMRTLVEQTRDNVGEWLRSLTLNDAVGLHVLMGGEDSGEWDIHPERPAILIGTQDMLLSRALNRGYGAGRARWPMHFGLLHNDCLWVLDETQLMGVGVRTSAQLEGLRTIFGTFRGCATWWASATLDQRLLDTPDHRSQPAELALDARDREMEEVQRRIGAVKRLTELPLRLPGDSAKIVDPYIENLASLVLEKHQAGTLSLVILNRVDRAKDLFAALQKRSKKQPLPECVLIHSRFRPIEREALSARIKTPGEMIIVSTQAIEAGVDISARSLITELAPWSSMVQRFGRCNRRGEFKQTGGADIFWINLEAEDEKNAESLALPYTPAQLSNARSLLRAAHASGASPAALEKIESIEPLPETHILRRKDLIELFDTTPDLAGLDIDVGRYIRDGEDRDVQVFWREIPEGSKPDNKIRPLRAELVRVSIGNFAKFRKEKRSSWIWSPLDGEWQRAERLSAGQIYLIDYQHGGYSETLGWTGEKAKEGFRIFSLADQSMRLLPRDGQGRDDESQFARDGIFQSIEEHTAEVVAAVDRIAAELQLEPEWKDALRLAAEWHDAGKAHPCFQRFITRNREIPQRLNDRYIAKAPWRGGRHERPHFRHELASALAWLQRSNGSDAFTRDLIAYVIAAHHGKLRLSIRSMPGERVPEKEDSGAEVLYARGIWHGEEFPVDEVKVLQIAGSAFSRVTLDLSLMNLGEQNGKPSWIERTLFLRDHPRLGIFRLAFLEAAFRAADARASAIHTSVVHPSEAAELRETSPPYHSSGELTDDQKALIAEIVRDGLAIQQKFRPEPLYKETGKGHYESDTVEEIRKAKKTKTK